MSKYINISTILLLLMIGSAHAYWPVRVLNDLPVAATSDTIENMPIALPFTVQSTIVIFRHQWWGQSYQIIDKYGQIKYPTPQLFTPGYIVYADEPHAVLDSEGGVLVAWNTQSPDSGVFAQKLDSLENLLWGDQAIEISPFDEFDFDICADIDGGMFLAVAPEETDNDMFVQKIDAEGNLLWGTTGVAVAATPDLGEGEPIVTSDGSGGVFVVWRDLRPPYTTYGALYAQHLDNTGNELWLGDLFLYEHPWFQQIISDGEGGFILHTGSGAENHLFRVNGDGNLLWTRDHVSWNSYAHMLPGEPGFFYLGYEYNQHNYGQRMDIEGNFYFPHYPNGYGAPMGNYSNMMGVQPGAYYFKYPYLYGVFEYHDNSDNWALHANILDLNGNALFGEFAPMLSYYDYGYGSYTYTNAVPGENYGFITVFKLLDNIYAKRINLDGTLGGPNGPIEDIIISISGDNIVLTWSSQASNANYYVYKSLEPYVFPTEPDTTIADTFYVDVDAVLEGMRFYDVRWQPLE